MKQQEREGADHFPRYKVNYATRLSSLPQGHWSFFPFKLLPAGFDLLWCLLLLLFLPVAHWRDVEVKSDLSNSSKATQWMKNQRWGHWLMSLFQSGGCSSSPACSVANFSGERWSSVYSHARLQNPIHVCVCIHVHNYFPACWLTIAFLRLMLMKNQKEQKKPPQTWAAENFPIV